MVAPEAWRYRGFMERTGRYRNWEYKLRRDRERRPSPRRRPRFGYLGRFCKTAAFLFVVGAGFATARMWAITYGSC
jgi:hypothetical protein